MKKLLLILLLVFASFLGAVENPDPTRFTDEINAFVKYDQKNTILKNEILFVGSSSIRMWKTGEAFPEYKLVNRGFGGAHISDIIHYFDQVVKPYAPKVILFYCGDNDVAGKKSPETVFNDYKTFVDMVHKEFPKTKIVYIPIKPSKARWDMWPTMADANQKILDFSNESKKLFYADIVTPTLLDDGNVMSDIFLDDGLHLSQKGYDIWNDVVRTVLKKQVKVK